MGKSLMGGSKISGTQSNLTPEQKQYLQSVLGGIGPQARAGYESLLQPMDQESMQNLFERSYVQPAQQALERSILPTIQQRFVDMGAGRSSALNQAGCYRETRHLRWCDGWFSWIFREVDCGYLFTAR